MTFLFFRFVTPIALLAVTTLYVFMILKLNLPLTAKLGICIFAAYIGMNAAVCLFLKNAIQKRQLSIRRAFPDALDLLLICVESGMSIEAAFQKVSTRDRRRNRFRSPKSSDADDCRVVLPAGSPSGLQGTSPSEHDLDVRKVRSAWPCSSRERYGTPLAQTLARHGAGESRHAHVEAEKKAAAPTAKTRPCRSICSSCRCCSSSFSARLAIPVINTSRLAK